MILYFGIIRNMLIKRPIDISMHFWIWVDSADLGFVSLFLECISFHYRSKIPAQLIYVMKSCNYLSHYSDSEMEANGHMQC
jgi:hypothetical protein